MTYYAQLYQKSAISNDLVECCGSDGIVFMDGRWNIGSIMDKAKRACIARNKVGYMIMKGEFNAGLNHCKHSKLVIV